MKPEASLLTALTLIFVWCFQCCAIATAVDCPGVELVTHIGERFTSTIKFEAGGSDRQREIPHPGARYMRARIEVASTGTCDWLLTIRDSDFHVIQTFNGDDFRTVSNRWTNRVPSTSRKVGNSTVVSSKIIFTLEGCKGASRPEIKFPEYVMMPNDAKNPYYSLQIPNRPSYRPLYGITDPDSAIIKPLGDNVGFLMSSWDRQSWTCSGVFLTETLFLTNWHCGGPGVGFPDKGNWNPQIVKDTIVDVSFDDDGLSQEYIGKSLVAMDTDLDFALLEVTPVDASRRARPVPINLGPLSNGMALRIVHHPAGNQKMVTLGCRVENARFNSWRKNLPGIDFAHKCDTEKGSSGGPVFNSNNELIGLHHRGFKVNPDTCMEEDRINKAVHIDKIFEFLQACHSSVAAKLALTTVPGPPIACPTPLPTP